MVGRGSGTQHVEEAAVHVLGLLPFWPARLTLLLLLLLLSLPGLDGGRARDLLLHYTLIFPLGHKKSTSAYLNI